MQLTSLFYGPRKASTKNNPTDLETQKKEKWYYISHRLVVHSYKDTEAVKLHLNFLRKTDLRSIYVHKFLIIKLAALLQWTSLPQLYDR